MKRCLLSCLLLVTVFSLGASAQQCSPLPCIVATASLTGQSGPLPLTTVYTPPASGMFRVSTYLSVSKTRNVTPTWILTFGWTDDNGPRNTTTSATQNGSNANAATAVIQSVGGQPLAYSTRLQGEDGETTYNVFIVVEQLQ
jgi:hypothetical protein